jgi:hypothetical protein
MSARDRSFDSARRASLRTSGHFALGLVGMLALRGIAPPLLDLPRVPAPVFVRTPLPIPMAMPRPSPVLIPTVVAAVPTPPLDGCPALAGDDELAPIGRPATEDDLQESSDAARDEGAIAASSTRPVLAVIDRGGALHVSDDDGRHWRAALGGHVLSSVAIDDRGRVYALGDDGLAVIDDPARDRARWTTILCPHEVCRDRLVAVPGGGVVHLHDQEIRLSRDGGRTWRALASDPDDDGDDGDRAGDGELLRQRHLFAMGTRLYGVSDVSDMCGWRADEIASIDLRTGHTAYQSFSDDAPAQLAVVDDAGATWRYAARGVPTAAAARDLILARRAPAIGARALFAEHGDLIELCGSRARLLSHAYGADEVDAVDAAGRALLVRGDAVLRWSARFGWRVLGV